MFVRDDRPGNRIAATTRDAHPANPSTTAPMGPRPVTMPITAPSAASPKPSGDMIARATRGVKKRSRTDSAISRWTLGRPVTGERPALALDPAADGPAAQPVDPPVKPAGRVRRMVDVSARFDTVATVRQQLHDVTYLADDGIAGVVFLADRLGKPVLVEGPAGTGKTQLAKSVAEMTGARLIRLQCYEGLDESKALYEWNYKKQLLRIQADRGSDSWSEIHDDIFAEEFLLTRPLLEAIRAEEPVVLLIDEVDRVEVETEALLLEILSDYQVSIPELGTITARQIPLVFLTSNNTRELSEALKRRCLYLHVDYPDLDREKAIVLAKVPDVNENLADQVARIVRSIRQLELKKAPSVSETLDWARTLVLLGIEHIDAQQAKETLHILLKYQTDIAKAAKELSVEAPAR
jgi:MoxR-like ATPase